MKYLGQPSAPRRHGRLAMGDPFNRSMQELRPAHPVPVPANHVANAANAYDRKEMTMNRASHGIVVGFVCQP